MARITEAPRKQRIHPAKEYSDDLHSAICESERMIKSLRTKRRIAAFLINHTANDIRCMIDEVDYEVKEVENQRQR